MVSGAAVEQQRNADLEHQLDHTESAALSYETRAALSEEHGEAGQFRWRGQWVPKLPIAVLGVLWRWEAYKSEVPILTVSMRRGEVDRSRQL